MATLKPEQKSLGEDGCWKTVRLAQRAVARVTCLGGQGPITGVPFMDDYISCEEEIFDHVTEVSGIGSIRNLPEAFHQMNR
ncbi:hypothetical protein TCAL_14514 [Tigriopus californicus]|uniref:Uncharacterized protein n=1 Tax=Tigriopus californicus TaxID=6832 RepID=A0A553PT45_TIGCA|nr:hypothetical protein TCAL_14514 [Tigriopus californicus]